MDKKRKYYLIGFLLLCIFIIGYHFFAASQAEQQIDEALQEQSAQNDFLSVQYSEIDIAPFSAAVSIRDLNIIFGDHIERSQYLQLDMSYLDFLNIYIGGLPYGLKRLDKADIQAIQPSYINRGRFEELKMDTLNISYTGNALDGLQSAINGTPFSSSQSIEARSSNLRIVLPKTPVAKLTAETFIYSGSITDDQQSFWTDGQHQFALDSLIWTPSQSMQQTYSFIIKGFGYDTDAIPFESVELHSQAGTKNDMLQVESSIRSELALLSGSGFIKMNSPLENSELQDMTIRITDFSESFSNVIHNAERLFSISLPKSDEGITLHIRGTFSNPSIVNQ